LRYFLVKINKDLQLAVTCHRRGDLTRAEALYKKALKKQPNNFDILHMLGRICYQLRDYDEAIRYIRKEIEIAPSNAEAHFNLAFILHNTGRLDEAVLSYQKAIKIEPGLMEAYNNLGILLTGKGRTEEAIAYFQKAMQINPNYADIYNNLGLTLKVKGDIDEAITNYKKAIDLNPAFADAYYNLGVALQVKKQLDEAITSYKKAVQLNPTYANAYNNLGTIYHEKGQLNEAIDYYQKVLNLHPDFIDAYYNIGIVLRDKGQFEESLQYFQKVIQIEPNHADSHWYLSFLLLLLGNFKDGWKEYEWRWKTKAFIPNLYNFPQPLWDGFDITGKFIFLHAEQGFGDTIQFIRYAPLVAQHGAKVIIGCPKELISLFQSIDGIHQIITWGEELPSFDVHCPLMSLPLVFGTTLDTIPAEIPYIKVNTDLLKRWKDKVRNDDSKFRVGLSWVGRPAHRNDSNRSFPLETLAPLAQSDGVIFYSLQKGKGSEQAKTPPEGMKLIDYTDEIQDFSDTAALIENLDLVISIDTAVAHLAGAMGKPVWTLLPFVPDWRWMLKREDSPWYPTMRLFRQPFPGDWESVISNVRKELKIFIRNESR